MDELVLSLGIGLYLYLVRRCGLMSPAAAFSVVSLMSMVVFYVIAVRGVSPDAIQHHWQVKLDYSGTASSVMSIYLFFLVLPVLATRPWSRRKQSAQRHAFPTPIIRGIRLSVLRRYLSSRPAVMFLALAVGACVVHFVDVDFGMVLSHYEYLITRHPDNVGLSNPVTGFIHRALGTLSCACLCLGVLYYRLRLGVFSTVAFAVASYCALFSLGGASRWIAVQCTVTALMLQLTAPKKVSRGAWIFGILAFVSYALVIHARRQQEIGLLPILNSVLSGEFFVDDFLAILALSLFGGGFVLAETLDRVGLAYPIRYKLLSFAPTISMLDGFDAIRHYEHRVNLTTPFSSFAEIYHFGAIYSVAYLAFLFLTLRVLTRFWQRTRNAGWAFLILAPVYLAFLNIHLYPIRNSFRLILWPVVIAVWMNRRFRVRERRARSVSLPVVEVEGRIAVSRSS